MEKILLKIFLIMSFLILINSSQTVFAHPASNIDLEYNYNNQKLTSTITHNTPDKEGHYIYKLKIYRNDIIVNDNEYTSQPTDNTFELLFDVSADEGDILKVWVECNIGGTNEKSITITVENGSTAEDNGTSTPGFEIISILFGLIFVLSFRKRKKE